MKLEEIGTISYGNLKFIFNLSEELVAFLQERNISFELLFPKTQFFYQGVLKKLGVEFYEDKEIFVVYHKIKCDDEVREDFVWGDYERFENFPIHVDDVIYLIDFVARVEN